MVDTAAPNQLPLSARVPLMDELEPRLLLSGLTANVADYFPLTPGTIWTYSSSSGGGPAFTETQTAYADSLSGVNLTRLRGTYQGWSGWDDEYMQVVGGQLNTYGYCERDDDEGQWYTMQIVCDAPLRMLPATITVNGIYAHQVAYHGTYTPDGQGAMSFTGTRSVSMTFTGWENVVTALGTFHTARMAYTFDTTYLAPGVNDRDIDYGTLWLARGVGIVQESSVQYSYEGGALTDVDSYSRSLTGVTGATYGPDLIVSDAHFTRPQNVAAGTPLSVLAGSPVTLTTTVQNQGNQTAGTFSVGAAYIVGDNFEDIPDNQVIGTALVSPSLAGGGATATRTFTFNAPQTPGRYSIGVKADCEDDGQVGETDDDNNYSTLLTLDVAAANVNLTAAFSLAQLPASTVSGNGQIFLVGVNVRNNGNVMTPATSITDITFYARKAGSADVRIDSGSIASANLGYLLPGAARPFYAYLSLPAGLASGTYTIVAHVDAGQRVAESSENDNQAVTAATVNVQAGFYDLAGAFGTVTLPTSVIAGSPFAGYVQLWLKNLGNIALPLGQKVNVQLYAVQGLTERALGAPLTGYPAYAPAGSQQLIAWYVSGATLPTGTYSLKALITPSPALNENDTTAGNNSVIANLSGQGIAIQSAAPFVDLVGEFGTITAPTAVTSGAPGGTIILPILVRNQGNTMTSATAKIDIPVYLRKDLQNLQVHDLADQNVAYMAPGGVRYFYAVFSLPPGVPGGTYNFVAKLDHPTSHVAESGGGEDNNTLFSTRTIAVTPGFVDIQSTIAPSSTLPKSVLANGPLAGWFNVNIKNAGNVPLPIGQQVNVVIRAHNVVAGPSPVVLSGTNTKAYVSYLAPGATYTHWTYISSSAGLPAGTYEIRAEVTPVQALTQSSTANDNALADAGGNAYRVLSAAPWRDLTGKIALSTLPATKTANSLLYGYVGLTYRNEGNAPVPGTVSMVVRVMARRAGQADIEIGNANVYVGGLAAQTALTTYVLVYKPANFLPAGQYDIVVVMQPNGGAWEANVNNNEATVNLSNQPVRLTVT